MSKIVFWSPMHGQGQTSNLQILALIMSLLYKKKVLMMQTHISMDNLEGPLTGRYMDIKGSEKDSIFQDIGLDTAVMYSRINKLMKEDFESCCLTFPGTSLFLLPGTGIRNREIYDRDVGSHILKLIQYAEDYVDIIMIDANSGNDGLSFRLMPAADLIVVNLAQRRHVLNSFFSEYGEKFNDYSKVFYLFGNYDRNSGYNIINCRRKYWKYISKNNSGVIPYSTRYMDALNECSIVNMAREGLRISSLNDISKLYDINNLKKSLRSKFRLSRYSAEETDYFFYQACLSADKIINMLLKQENKIFKRSGA